MDEKKAWDALQEGDLKTLEKELNSKPEGKIFEEMDTLADELREALGIPENAQAAEYIKEVLDNWVANRVVRFQWSEKCDGDLARRDEDYREAMEGEVMDEMSGAIIENCGLTEITDDELRLTFYVLAFKEVF